MTRAHLAIVGPTASGKSALALEVACTLGDVELVSIDSMQVYRGLDIGTAKPSPAEQAQVPHHLVDVAEPTDEWSVARFQQEARAVVVDIEARGKRALLVGGTGLYVQAVVDPLTFPPEDRAVREAILTRSAEHDLYAELTAVDPDAAAGIEPSNTRRLARALEVIELTGRPFSSFGTGLQTYGPTVFPVHLAGVWLPRDVVHQRIADRVVEMFDAGFVDEVRALRDTGALSRTAAQAIGYREVLEHLDGNGPSLDAVLDAIVIRTRQFARRQRMWFRRDPRIVWFGAPENPCSVLPALLASWSA
ncbi:MAG TPA: tRNA (adenosine(37)-N6)-dimethylallyltransferase MiaA [Acidimicrobiia bacterium]|nr:tRNA (adenosine(37)-N6)-dimethylallyltransferase MiaA [Acidimicrobiia bacterium]